MNGPEILGDLLFVQAELPTLEPQELQVAIDTTCALPILGSPRKIQLAAPFFVRGLGRSQFGAAWAVFCGLLRQHGTPLFSAVPDLEDVPATALPARWARRFVNEPFDALELTTADAFELCCHDRSRHNWGWPSEVGTARIRAFVTSVRQAAGGDTLVGVSLPMGCHAEDLRHCLTADSDFVSLIAKSSVLEAGEIHSLVKLRRLCREMDVPDLPIFVTTPLACGDEAVKLLALGASAVCIDDLLLPLIPEAASTFSVGSGMLSGIAPAQSHLYEIMTGLDSALTELKRGLESRLRSVGANNLGQLNTDCLKSCSESSQLLTGIPRLVMQ